jgi:NADH dehydrogenase [ubiquinone] 1 alpha subcomplex assembly factor 1
MQKNTYLILLISLILLSAMTNDLTTIIDFNPSDEKEGHLKNWEIVGDNVMGGKSSGTFQINEQGNGVFQGEVSLENNGGFSLLRHQFQKIKVRSQKKILLKIKGDGKRYQFRIKAKSSDHHSYVTYFSTSGEWETAELSLSTMQAKYRGRQLDVPNFDSDYLTGIAFLIGNKKAEKFKLEIGGVYLK